MQKIRIGKIGKTITGKTPSSKCPEDFGTNYLFITPSDDFDNKFIWKTERYLSEGGLEKLKNKILPKNTILVTCIGSAMGKVAINKKTAISNQQINAVIPDEDQFDPDYVYYLFKNNYKNFRNAAVGSTAVPLLNKTEFDNLEFKVHKDLNTQRRISKILSALDDKIELNNRINEVLEAKAKLLYDYWFVQFEFPTPAGSSSGIEGKPYKSSGGKMVYNKKLKREIPEGWEVKRLEELGDFKNGVNYDPSKPGPIACPIINVRNISASTYFIRNDDLDVIYLKQSEADKYMVNDNSIIIARSGIPGATRLINEHLDNTLYCGFAIHFDLKDVKQKNILFFFLKSIEMMIQSGAGGTIMKNVNQQTLKKLLVSMPKENEIIKEFNKQLEPIFNRIKNIQKQNQHLASLRDWLLPMLMNGQVSVEGAYEMVDGEFGMVAEEREKYE